MSNDIVNIDICVCTFKRPQIAETLASIAALELAPNMSVRVIIADNDETTDAQSHIEQAAQANALSYIYVHAPARNISIARNACLDNVTAPIAVFMDDDEVAEPNWLKSLYQKWQETDASAVLGPVKAVYDNTAPQWMRDEDFHSIYPVWVNGVIVTGYTSNVLLDFNRPIFKELRFLEELGQSGGEDSTFFATLHSADHKIEYAEDAILTEIVPANRAKFIWLAKRRFRMGQTHARMVLEDVGDTGVNRTKNFVKAAAKATFCLARGLLHFFNRGRMAFWILRGMLHLGVISRLLGKKDLKQYG